MTDLLIRKNRRPAVAMQYQEAALEDRCAQRHKVAIPAKLRFSCSSSFAVGITDMSISGFSCDALLQLHNGTRCWLTLPGLGALEAEVVRHDNHGLGCAFSNLLNPAVLARYVARYPAPEQIEK